MIEFENVNVNKIAQFISSGEKKLLKKNVGVECEHFIVDKNGEAVSFYGENGVETILQKLSVYYPEKTFSKKSLVGLTDGVVYITLEPAAQIEVSIIPLDDLNKIHSIYLDFRNKIIPILDEYGYKLINSAYQPKSKVDELELIPKERYSFMDSYFISKGYKARYMMRGSASVQVNIDYTDENDFSQKFRLANLLSPLFYLVTDNADVFENQQYNAPSLRSYIWENVDASRCGVLDFESYFDYARWIYNTEPIFIQQNGQDIYCDRLTNKEIFKTKELSLDDIKHIMSMVFPNVRVKQFIEIRPGDSMPADLMISYSALIKGLFYNADALKELNEMWANITADDIEEQIREIRKNGFDCKYFGFDMKFVLEKIFTYANNSLNDDEKALLKPLRELAYSFKSPKHSRIPEVALL